MDNPREVRSVDGLPLMERTVEINRAEIDAEARTFDLSFSSESRIERWWGIEILDHASGAVRMDRLNTGRHPLLVNHDTDRQVGVIEGARIKDRRGIARPRMGRSPYANEIFTDVQDGIRTLVSVGYLIHQVVLESSPDSPGGDSSDSRTLTGDEFMARVLLAQSRAGGEEEEPVYRITDWEPIEISLVSIPADASVGVGRSAITSSALNPPEKPGARKETIMENTTPGTGAQPTAQPLADVRGAEERGRLAEAARASEIIATGEQFAKHGGLALASEAIRSGKDLKWLTDELLKRMATQPISTGPNIGLSDQEVKRYSVSRAIIGMFRASKGDANAWKDAGFEHECHIAAEKACGRGAQNGGILVPFDVQHARGLPWQQQRDLTTTPGSAGGYLVSTTNQPGSFIELLRNSARVLQAGVTVLPGLKDNITIPKQTGASTLYWLANESTAITESNLTFGQVALSPKNAGAYVEISHQLMQQSAPAADALVWADFARVGAIGIDTAVLNGSGASGQPLGILGAAGTGSVTGTSIDFAKCLEFQTDVAGGNALTDGFSYLTTPTVAALLMQRVQFTGTASPLWVGGLLDGRLLGMTARASTNVPSATMIGGDFSQILMGEWGTMELALNPYANFAAGIVGLRMWLTIDVGVRQAAAFSIATSIT